MLHFTYLSFSVLVEMGSVFVLRPVNRLFQSRGSSSAGAGVTPNIRAQFAQTENTSAAYTHSADTHTHTNCKCRHRSR